MEVLKQVVTFSQISDLKRTLTLLGGNRTFTKEKLMETLLNFNSDGESEESITALVDVLMNYLENQESNIAKQQGSSTFSVASLSELLTTLDNQLVQAEVNSPEAGSGLVEEEIDADIGDISFEDQTSSPATFSQPGHRPHLALIGLVEKIAVVTEKLGSIKISISSNNTEDGSRNLVVPEFEKVISKLKRYKEYITALYPKVEVMDRKQGEYESEIDRLSHRIRELELDFANVQAAIQATMAANAVNRVAPTRAFSQVITNIGEESINDEKTKQITELKDELKRIQDREQILLEKNRILENLKSKISPKGGSQELTDLVVGLNTQRDLDAKLIESLKNENSALKAAAEVDKRTIDSMRKDIANIKSKLGESNLYDSGIQIQASKLANFYRTSNLPISFCNEEQATGKYRLLQPGGTGESAPGIERLQVLRLSSRESVINIQDSHFGQFLKTLPPHASSAKKDYLGLRFKPNLFAELSRFGENLSDGTFLSDYVVVYDRKNSKKRLIIAITQQYLFLHNPENLKQLYFSPLSRLKVVSISSKNCALANLQFEEDSKSILLESYRRTELVIYIARMQKEAGCQVYSFKIRKHLRSGFGGDNNQTSAQANTQDGKPAPGLLADKSGGGLRIKESSGKLSAPKEKDRESKESNFLQETLRNSKKSGYLKVLRKNFFGHYAFVEFFCVLSNLGIIAFKKYGDKQPGLFLPILGADVKKLEDAKNKGYWELAFESDSYHVQSVSEHETEEWVRQIKQLQSKSLTSKDTLKEMGKVT
jgi:Unconventional myosin tail, actin- and lipid-binding/PH domain